MAEIKIEQKTDLAVVVIGLIIVAFVYIFWCFVITAKIQRQ
jgi:hypothetical protein